MNGHDSVRAEHDVDGLRRYFGFLEYGKDEYPEYHGTVHLEARAWLIQVMAWVSEAIDGFYVHSFRQSSLQVGTVGIHEVDPEGSHGSTLVVLLPAVSWTRGYAP